MYFLPLSGFWSSIFCILVLLSLLYLFFCNTTKLSKEINRFFSAFAQTLEVNVLEHVRGYFPPMSFASRSARAEKPILFSCSSSRPIIMQILPFSTTPIHKRGPKLGFTGWRKGLKEKVTQTHKFSSLKRPFGVVGILLSSSRQSKMHLNVLFNRNIVWGVVLQGRVWFSLFCMCYVGVSQSSENKPIWYGCYLSDSFVIHSTLSKESFFLPLFFRSSFVSASSIVHF